VILFVRMRAPIPAYGLVVLLNWSGTRMAALTFLGLPIATDPDVFGAAKILLTGLVRLLRRCPASTGADRA